MKKLCLALFAAIALLVPGAGFSDPIVSTVRVAVRNLENYNGYGSGIVLAPGIVLTAHHVAVGQRLYISNGKVPSEPLALGNGDPLDIAIIRFPASQASCPCVRLADYPALLDEPVWIVGYPAKSSWQRWLHRAVRYLKPGRRSIPSVSPAWNPASGKKVVGQVI